MIKIYKCCFFKSRLTQNLEITVNCELQIWNEIESHALKLHEPLNNKLIIWKHKFITSRQDKMGYVPVKCMKYLLWRANSLREKNNEINNNLQYDRSPSSLWMHIRYCNFQLEITKIFVAFYDRKPL